MSAPSSPVSPMRLLPPLLLGLALVVVPALAATKDPESDLKRVQQRIEKLQQSVREDIGRRDKLTVTLRKTEGDARDARARLDAVRRQVRETDARLADLDSRREAEEERLEEQRAALAAELRSAYVTGREEQLKLLLSQKDPAQLGRVLAYYGYLGRARAGRIGEIEGTVARLEELAADEQAERDRLAALEKERERELAAVDAARAERARALAAINSGIKTRNDSIAKLKREAATLEKLLADLRRALEDSPAPSGQPFARVRGKLPWPAPGKIVANFGQSRGGGLKWNGVLIATARGTEVRAPYAGRVAYSDWLPGLGLLLIIDHGGGYMTLYGHNEQLFKSVGESVKAGDVIGTVGDSGGQAQPELYVEVRRGRTPEDPRRWFRGSGP